MSHQKEISKFLKLISAKKLEKNHRECIELYNIVGGVYSEIGSYDEAAHYHEQALELSKTIGDRLATAVSFRYIGEAKASTGNFLQAIDYIKKYLELAQKLNNKVETQRAWTTLGRVYLMQAQEIKDKNNVIDKQTKEIAREAEKKFQTALNLAESVRDQVDDKEYAQMTSGLLINLGLIKDIIGQHNEAVIKFNRAMEICRSAKLKEDLYRCQIILASIYRQRNEVKMAVKTSEDALATAKSIGKKILICDALIERGHVRICQRDFKNAKRTFAQAYLEKSPSEEDHLKAIKFTKLAHLITSAYEKICKDNTPSDNRLKLCDKLGDLFIAIGNYKLAVEFYRRAFSDAKVCSKPKSELARILFSVAETYADDGQFAHALVCYEKELNYRDGNSTEQCQSLIKIAHMHENLEHDSSKVSEAYEKALDKAGKDPKLMHNVLRYYVPYMRQKSFNAGRYRELEEVLKNLKSYPEVIEDLEGEDYDESNELEDEIANIDDVITDDEDNDEVLMIGRRKARGANKFKQNEVGDTPLHEASIKGDLKRVKSLVAQGHEINPRDNAGWIPLHEACNHGHYDVAEFLIEHGADVNNRGLRGMSPLHDAATNGHYEIMRLLIKNGANVISLTDTGETVLSCLRDYKGRNYSSMTNRDASEYKQMEAELLNAMDRCGYNLMNENMKNLGTRSGKAVISAHTTQQQKTREPQLLSRSKAQISEVRSGKPVKNTETMTTSTGANRPRTEVNTNSVREYRDAITTLKRKRPLDVSQPSKRASQPATVASSISTSVSTKHWLLSDNIVEQEDGDEEVEDDGLVHHNSATKKCPSRSKIILEDQDDDEVLLIEQGLDRQHRASPLGEKSRARPEMQNLPSQSQEREYSPVLPFENWDQSLSPNELQQEQESNSRQGHDRNASRNSREHSISRHDTRSRSPVSLESFRSACQRSSSSPFDLFTHPLAITIEGRKLLIPIKEEYLTIAELKKSIVDRYSVLINALPKISLAPTSDPECFLFDSDLCRDVIRDTLVATIDSWHLDTIEASYMNECRNERVTPNTFVKLEMRRLDEKEDKIDLAFLKFPQAHFKPIFQALSRRSFTCANFQGSNWWFECQRFSQVLLGTTLFTWSKLTRLNLRCTGLLRFHFELLCNSKSKLPALQYLDVSVNSIAYRKRITFTQQVEKLREVFPRLKRLDVRKNHLLFVKSLVCKSSTDATASLLPATSAMEVNKTTVAQTTTSNSSSSSGGANKLEATDEEKESVDFSKALGLCDIEIFASDQYDYTIYLIKA